LKIGRRLKAQWHLVFFIPCLVGGDLGGTGFSRCDEMRASHGFFAQAKACATLSCTSNSFPQPKKLNGIGLKACPTILS
jgi:hypothetical protein